MAGGAEPRRIRRVFAYGFGAGERCFVLVCLDNKKALEDDDERSCNG